MRYLVYFLLAITVSLLLSGCVRGTPGTTAQEKSQAKPEPSSELESRIVDQQRAIAELVADQARSQQKIKEQTDKIAGLETIVSQSSVKHNGLISDAAQMALVKSKLDQPTWQAALNALKATADAYLGLTPQPIRGPWSLPSPFEDEAANDAMVRPLEESTDAMLSLAQYYSLTGDNRYANKAIDVLNAWTGSLMELESEQSLYEASWELLAMTFAADLLRDHPGWAASQKKAFREWINERTWHIISRLNETNNHQYWVAAQAAAVGVFTDDRGLLDWAVAVYKKAISFDIMPDGHMPQETSRGKLGIFYQNFAIEALSLAAEIARKQDIDLWDYSYRGKNLKLAIDYLFVFLQTPEKWTWHDKPQEMTFLGPRKNNEKIGWFEIANYHYQDKIFAKYLAENRPIFSRRVGGMITLTHGLPLK